MRKVGRIEILQLMYMSNIKQCDEAIDMFRSLLLDTGIYQAYKHLNNFYYVDSKWLISMTIRYRKEEWEEFREWMKIVIKAECWKLKLPSPYMRGYSMKIEK